MLFPLICRSFSVRHGGCSCSLSGGWHRKRTDAKNFILVLVGARMHVDDDITFFPKEGWTFTVFGSEDDLYLMIAKSCVTCVVCWQLLAGTCQNVWFETAVASYWRTSLPSGKMIIKLFVFYDQECFLISLLILVQFWGFWPQKLGGYAKYLKKNPKANPLCL